MCIKHTKSLYLSSWCSSVWQKCHGRIMRSLLVLQMYVCKVIHLTCHICRELWFDQVLCIKKYIFINKNRCLFHSALVFCTFWNKTCLKIKDRPRSTCTVYTVCVWPFSPQINDNNNTSTLGADSENVYTHASHDNFHSFRGHEEKTLSHAIHW